MALGERKEHTSLNLSGVFKEVKQFLNGKIYSRISWGAFV